MSIFKGLRTIRGVIRAGSAADFLGNDDDPAFKDVLLAVEWIERGQPEQLTRLVSRLASALSEAAGTIMEGCCSCIDMSNGHQRGCVGVRQAARFNRLATRIKNRERKI